MAFETVKQIWMNGRLVDFADAKVHVFTHALHYGSGVFEGIRCYKTARGPEVFRLDDHLDRLFWSAKIYRMDVPYSHEQLRDATLETIRANGFSACYIRPLVYRGYGSLGVNPFPNPVDVAIGPEGGFDGPEEELLERSGAVPFGLGRRILRLETAVVGALSRLVDDDAP